MAAKQNITYDRIPWNKLGTIHYNCNGNSEREKRIVCCIYDQIAHASSRGDFRRARYLEHRLEKHQDFIIKYD